jgi:uncharacterized membrane protein YheB (UPF0754 family)
VKRGRGRPRNSKNKKQRTLAERVARVRPSSLLPPEHIKENPNHTAARKMALSRWRKQVQKLVDEGAGNEEQVRAAVTALLDTFDDEARQRFEFVLREGP